MYDCRPSKSPKAQTRSKLVDIQIFSKGRSVSYKIKYIFAKHAGTRKRHAVSTLMIASSAFYTFPLTSCYYN